MKKFIALVFVVVFIFSGVAYAGTLLFEDWESGTIDSNAWTKFGSPLPVIATPGHESSYAIDINGDNSWNSGFHTAGTFDATYGITADFWAKGNSPSSYAQVAYIGITSNELVTSGQDNGYQILGRVNVSSDSDVRQISFGADAWGEWYTVGYEDNLWHHYQIAIDSLGYGNFYMDNDLKFTTSSTIDVSGLDVRFQGLGKAGFAPMLIDDITISAAPVPEPATMFLFGSGLFVLAGFRRKFKK